jgi:hypothetical protein
MLLDADRAPQYVTPVRVGEMLNTFEPVPVASVAVAPVPPRDVASVPNVMLVALRLDRPEPMPLTLPPRTLVASVAVATAPLILDPDIPVAMYAFNMLFVGSTIDVTAVSVVAVIVPPMMLPTLDHVAAFAEVRLLHATVPVIVGDMLKTLLPVPVASVAVAPVPPCAVVSVPVTCVEATLPV